jgi:hypothetical protein
LGGLFHVAFLFLFLFVGGMLLVVHVLSFEFGRLLRMLWTIHFWSGAYLFDEISNRLDHQGPPIP